MANKIGFGSLRKGFTIEEAAIATVGSYILTISELEQKINDLKNAPPTFSITLPLDAEEVDELFEHEQLLVSILEVIAAFKSDIVIIDGVYTGTILKFLRLETYYDFQEEHIDYQTTLITRESLVTWCQQNKIPTTTFDSPIDQHLNLNAATTPPSNENWMQLSSYINTINTAREAYQAKGLYIQKDVLGKVKNSLTKILESAPEETKASIEKLNELQLELADKNEIISEQRKQIAKLQQKAPDPDNEMLSCLDKSNQCYSPKLAAAIKSWLAISNSPPTKTRTAKQRLTEWLSDNWKELELSKEDKKSNQPIRNQSAIDEVAKISNWDIKGGVPKSN
jgi:hypothetical protein